MVELVVEDAVRGKRQFDVNQIHARTYELILEYRSQYYEDRLDEFLDGIAVSDDCRRAVRDALLKPVNVGLPRGVGMKLFSELPT